MNPFQKESSHSLLQQMLHLEYFSFLPVQSWQESDPVLYNRTFEAQFERMRHEGSLLGIVAIENTIAGSLLQNHELLRRSENNVGHRIDNR